MSKRFHPLFWKVFIGNELLFIAYFKKKKLLYLKIS